MFTDAEWQGLCTATGHPEWEADPRFASLLARKGNEDALDAAVQEWTSRHPSDEVMHVLQAHGVPAGVVQHAGDLIETDPQMKARGFYRQVEHPEIGSMLVEGVPFQLSETPGYPRRPAPLLGEHNDLVLQEVLGMGEDEVNGYIVDGAVM